MDILLLLIGLALGFTIGFLYFKSQNRSAGNDPELQNLKTENARMEERVGNVNAIKAELEEKRTELIKLNSELTEWKTKYANLDEKLSTQKTEVEDLQNKFTKEFENLANRILEEKSKKFTEQNKTNLDIILNPLKEKIKDFETQVEKTYKAESAERIILKTEIKNLVEFNKQVSTEANNLAKALKGDNKMQGNWGEVILEKIMERSGLVKDLEYKAQVSTTDSEGKRIQPDVIVYLPDNKHVVVDAKVSLIAYEIFVNAVNDDDKPKFIKAHVESVKSHIKILSDKNYQSSPDITSPDFVLLFIPIESSFSIAVQADQELFNYAWDRKVVIVSPSTLLATLRTIASIWKQERQTRNAMEIAEQGGKLYDKFEGLMKDLLEVGNKMKLAQGSYEEAMKKLSTGPGNLVRKVEELKKLGAKTTKTLPQNVIDRANETGSV